jgi:hypothetical protein
VWGAGEGEGCGVKGVGEGCIREVRKQDFIKLLAREKKELTDRRECERFGGMRAWAPGLVLRARVPARV